jgi:hypothetical protein
MTALATDARDTIVAALSGVGANVYTPAPPAPVAPFVVITADAPWMVPAVIGGRLRMELSLKAVCGVPDRAESYPALESLVESVLVALPDGAMVTQVDDPAAADNGPQGSVLASVIRFTVHIRE